MALTMKDKATAKADTSAWPEVLKQEFEREARAPNGCVGNALVSETNRLRVWTIRLKPGERFGFHRHVLDYFWTAVSGGRGRQHLMDGTTVEYLYAPGETSPEAHGADEVKVHAPENVGAPALGSMPADSIDSSANKPLSIPQAIRPAKAA